MYVCVYVRTFIYVYVCKSLEMTRVYQNVSIRLLAPTLCVCEHMHAYEHVDELCVKQSYVRARVSAFLAFERLAKNTPRRRRRGISVVD